MLHDHDRETCCALPDEARLAASQAWSRGDFVGQLLATGRLLRFRVQAEIDACPDCQGAGESPLGETCETCRTLRADLYEYDDAVWRWRTRDEKSLRERAARQQAHAEAQAEIKRIESQPPDAWEAISQRVEELEQEQADRIEETVRRIYEGQQAVEARVVRLEGMVARLLGMWV